MNSAQIAHMATLPPEAARAYMRECRMPSEDLERLLYITGRTAEAALIGSAIDEADDEIDSMRHERDEAQAEASRLEGENYDLQTAVEAAEEKVLTLSSDLENAQDEIEQLRAEIRAKCLDLL